MDGRLSVLPVLDSLPADLQAHLLAAIGFRQCRSLEAEGLPSEKPDRFQASQSGLSGLATN